MSPRHGTFGINGNTARIVAASAAGGLHDASHYGDVAAGMQRCETADHKVGNSRWRISPSCGVYVTLLIGGMTACGTPLPSILGRFPPTSGVYAYGNKRAST